MIKKIFLGLVFLSLLGGYFAPLAHAAPPENFQKNLIVGSGLEGPSGFEFAPDGRIFILERTGKVKIVKNGVLLAQPFADLPSVATGDRGLIGIAFDPDFNTNHYVYFYYTSADDLLNRLVRFNASGDVGTEGPFILYETTSPSQQLHVGGSIRFGPDGKIYFAVGDNGYPPNAQNLTNPHGKILRINKDGSIPADNPLVNVPGALKEIWAYGLRNPWRFQFDSATGQMYGGDVGDFSVEEVNHIVKGGNYGWSICEGVCDNPDFINPIYAYNHEGASAAATGGPVYRANMFPPEYQGSFFFGDYAKSFIKRCVLNANGNCSQVLDFDTAAGSVVDMKVSPVDGSFWYLTYIPGRLYKVTYSTGNQYPIPNSSANVLKGVEPLTINFSSQGSSDPNGDPLTYAWNFGDGTTSNQANPQKTFTQKGTYEVNLAVSDGVNVANAVPIVIQVGLAPTVNIAQPNEGDTYKAGDTISYQISSLDGAGFDINDAAIKTDVIFHHSTHIHPFIDDLTGRTGSFTIPNTGEASPDTWYELQVTVTDSNGLMTKASRNIYPIKSDINLNSNIPGLSIYLDGVPTVTNKVLTGVAGFFREISAPAIQVLNGISYAFDFWSDGGAPRHEITFSSVTQTIVANFKPSAGFKIEYFDNINLAGAPKITTSAPEINFFWDMGSPDPQIPTDNFSARFSKTQYFAKGNYKFNTISDDGIRVFVDNLPVIDEWHDQGSDPHSGEMFLEAGDHNIVVEYFEHGGGAVARFNWDLAPVQPVPSPTPTPAPAAGFTGEYFDNMTLSGAAKLTRIDPEINFIWNETAPDTTIPADHYSVRWTKNELFEAGTHEFTVTGDDGIRLFVDGEKILDKWIDQASTTYKVNKALTAGYHSVVLEYYENDGGAIAKLSYIKTSDLPSSDKWSAKFWNVPGTGEFPPIPTTVPVLVRDDDAVNFQWDAASPGDGIDPDHFVAVWEKNHQFAAGNYKFTTESDDGMNVYIDGKKVLDEWNDHSMTYIFYETLTAAVHNIKIEYYENDGGAKAKIKFEPTGAIPPFYTVEYFNNPTLAGAPVLTRDEQILYYVWAEGSPDPLVNVNNFSARWAKTDVFEKGTYHFTLFGDDGMKLYIDGNLEIDDWDVSQQIHAKDIPLSAGSHDILVEYYEGFGGAYAKMYFEKISDIGPDPTPTPTPTASPTPTPTPPTGVYKGEYWNNPTQAESPTFLTAPPTLTRDDATIDFTWNNDAPAPTINADKFLVRWTKNETFENSSYKFTLHTDDGAKLYIDDELVINDWVDHAEKTTEVTKAMTAGTHKIVVEYYENGGGAVAKFNFAKVGGPAPTPTPTLTPTPTPGPAGSWLGEYFDNQNLTGTPKLTRQDDLINFLWELDPPAPEIPAEHFSVRWTKTKTYTAGTYKFTLKSDDGIRFYVDENLIVDDWTNHAMKIYNPDVPLTEGSHILKVEYFDNDNNAIAIVEEK